MFVSLFLGNKLVCQIASPVDFLLLISVYFSFFIQNCISSDIIENVGKQIETFHFYTAVTALRKTKDTTEVFLANPGTEIRSNKTTLYKRFD
jgi:hypothetical protein